MPDPGLRITITPQSLQPYFPSFPAKRAVADRWRAARHVVRWRALLCGGIATTLLFAGSIADAEPVGAAPPVEGVSADPIAAFVVEASQRFGIPAAWIRAVMQAESAGDARARSPKGALGLMQIMPETWAVLRSRYNLGADPYDIHDNILGGAAFLRELHDRYGEPGFLAAYNAGPARYEEHLATGHPLPAETQAYVAALAPVIRSRSIDGPLIVSAVALSWSKAPLFAGHAESDSTTARPPHDAGAGAPSVARSAGDWTALAPRSDGLFVRRHAVPERAR